MSLPEQMLRELKRIKRRHWTNFEAILSHNDNDSDASGGNRLEY